METYWRDSKQMTVSKGTNNQGIPCLGVMATTKE